MKSALNQTSGNSSPLAQHQPNFVEAGVNKVENFISEAVFSKEVTEVVDRRVIRRAFNAIETDELTGNVISAESPPSACGLPML